MVKRNVRKYNICHDELKIKGNGLYSFFPFEHLDESHKGVFKCGRTSQDLSSRIENYHSYFPLGVYIVFFLQYPRIQRGLDKEALHREMEKELFENLKGEGGKMLDFPSRPSKKSEWFYCSFNQLRKAFLKTQDEYGGVLSEYSLSSLNSIYKKNMKNKDKFVGEIVYPV
jgi:hypothetical protein